MKWSISLKHHTRDNCRPNQTAVIRRSCQHLQQLGQHSCLLGDTILAGSHCSLKEQLFCRDAIVRKLHGVADHDSSGLRRPSTVTPPDSSSVMTWTVLLSQHYMLATVFPACSDRLMPISVSHFWHAVVGSCYFCLLFMACSGWLLMLLLFQAMVGCKCIATAPYSRLAIQQ